MVSNQVIHLYTLCWNERRMLPFFFRHYDDLVDEYFVFDNGSTDGTLDMLKAHRRVHVEAFETENESFVETERRVSDVIWQASRRTADWVIVVDMDEHLYHVRLRDYLQDCGSENVTAISATGYEMVSETFPAANAKLCEVVTCGVPSHYSSKPCVFNPSAIEETNFSHGRHSADPRGRVIQPAAQEVLMLHYKQLGLEYVRSRLEELGAKLPDRDVERGFALRYRYSADRVAAEFNHLMALAAPVPQLSATSGQVGFTPPVTIELSRLNQLLAAQNTELWRLTRMLSQGSQPD